MKTENGESVDRRQVLGSGLAVFERQVLVFPLLVVFLACASFLFGGHCAAWQWWAAVGAVVGVPFLKRGGWRTALMAAGLFAGLLVTVKCFLPPVLWDNASFPDTRFYQLPMVQLLVEGWNPVVDPLAHGITAKLGLDLWGMAPVHVAFLSKTMAVFAAVAYRFVGDPTGLTVLGLAFLWLGVALQAMRLFHGVPRWVVLAALIWVLPMVPGGVFVDVSLAFAACGLLFSQVDALRQKQCDWLALSVWTIWMTNIKLNGMLAAVVFWIPFVATMLWLKRHEWPRLLPRFALFGFGMALALCIISWNPFITSWKAYGHPLYPFKTINADKWPVQDLTWDFRVANDDYHAMGKMGIWVREYVSPRLSEAYYRWKLEKDDFAPQRPWYPMETTPQIRLAFWIVILLLLAHPRGRWIGVGGLLLTGIIPSDKIGYLRYQPWISSLGCLAVALSAEHAFQSLRQPWKSFVTWGLCSIFFGLGCHWLLAHARNVEFKATELSLDRERVRCRFFKNGRQPSDRVDINDFSVNYNYLTAQENHCRLLMKELGRAGKTQVLSVEGWRPTKGWEALARRPLWKWDQRQWFIPEDERDCRCLEDLGTPWQEGNVWEGFCNPAEAEPWIMTPMKLYWVPLGDHTEHFIEYFTVAEPREGETRMGRAWRRAKYALKAWGMTYPKEVWRWMCGRQWNRNQ